MYRVTAAQGIIIIAILLRILFLLRTGWDYSNKSEIDALKSVISDLERDVENFRIIEETEEGRFLSVISGCGDCSGIEEIKSLLKDYFERSCRPEYPDIEESGNRLDQTEMDYESRESFDEGMALYRTRKFGQAACAFRKVLYIEPENEEAAAFFYSALFNENPGDDGLYREIKDELAPLAEGGFLSAAAETAALKTLAGISLEEGDRESAERYRTYITASGVSQ